MCNIKKLLSILLIGGAVCVRAEIPAESFNHLKEAVRYLSETYPDEYPAVWLRAVNDSDPRRMNPEEFTQLSRRALSANPLLTRYPIIYVERNQYHNDHHNTATLFQPGEINAGSYDTRGKLKALSLPGGDIVFSSTREPKYCMCNRHIMCNLFRMEADGANIHQIGKSTLFEGHSSLTPDGRILYSRWEYVDRNFGDAQSLWLCNPDGTQHIIYWGNNTSSPGGVLNAHIIPGTDLCLAVLAACHDKPWGALAIIDRNKGVDGKESVLRTWPAEYRERISTTTWEDYDTPGDIRLKYEDPWPLDEHFFLAARMLGSGTETGIVLVDTFGNEVILHQNAPGCYDPMPAAPRPMPPARPTARDFESTTGKFYVQNVYIGTHMKGVEPGAVKYLRVVESPEKRSFGTWNDGWFGQGEEAPAMNWHSFENKRILGTVPVEDDGSAYFEVPANRFVYFQLLDKDGMMIQSMRSGTIIQPGETQGCVGCHENRVGAVPPAATQPKAVKRAPDTLKGWYGKPRNFNYLKEVQPVFTKNCAGCHDVEQPAGEKLILAADKSIPFNASYTDLWRTGAIKAIGAGPAAIQEPYSWGSHASKIVEKIRNHHNNVNLTPEEFDRVVTWIDINAVYYPDYDNAYPDSLCGRSPISFGQRNRLQELTGIRISNNHRDRQAAQVYFDRPEKSPILKNLDKDSPEYKEALDIIQSGKDQLAQRPRADMDGFVPWAKHQRAEEKYQARAQEEARVYQAIREGKKVYDPGVK